LLLFGYLGWQLYVTDWINAGVQEEATRQLEADLSQAEPVPETVPIGEEVVDRYAEEPAPIGIPFGFITMPTIGVEDVVIYEGVDRETLMSGPGHMPTTPLPGQPGNSVLSGHRTTHGRPFFDLDLLEVGDPVRVRTRIGIHVYEVREILVVAPTDVWVADPREGAWLTLTTCEPKFSSRQRLVIQAEMVDGPNRPYVEATA
jgi:sortase A